MATDLDIIKQAFDPFRKELPFFARGMFDSMFTHGKIKQVYETVGGEAGVEKLAAALVRIGTGETIGLP